MGKKLKICFNIFLFIFSFGDEKKEEEIRHDAWMMRAKKAIHSLTWTAFLPFYFLFVPHFFPLSAPEKFISLSTFGIRMRWFKYEDFRLVIHYYVRQHLNIFSVYENDVNLGLRLKLLWAVQSREWKRRENLTSTSLQQLLNWFLFVSWSVVYRWFFYRHILRQFYFSQRSIPFTALLFTLSLWFKLSSLRRESSGKQNIATILHVCSTFFLCLSPLLHFKGFSPLFGWTITKEKFLCLRSSFTFFYENRSVYLAFNDGGLLNVWWLEFMAFNNNLLWVG